MMARIGFFISLLLAAQLSYAHHSLTGLYDKSKHVEVSGVIAGVRWANPHIVYRLDVTGDDGKVVQWEVAGGSLNQLKKQGLDRGYLKEGDKVIMAGYPSVRNRPELFAENVLLENGEEVLLDLLARPRWPNATRRGFVEQEVSEAARQEAIRTAESIFRVWTPDGFGSRSMVALTAEAMKIKDAWDPASNRRSDCRPAPTPNAIGGSFRMAFVHDGDNIAMLGEEFDARRTILMSQESIKAVNPNEYSHLGTSIGRWEDKNTLIIETTNIEAWVSTFNGTPQSRKMKVVERIELNEISKEEATLKVTTVVSDPETYVQPYQTVQNWIWRPGVKMVEYNCDPESADFRPEDLARRN